MGLSRREFLFLGAAAGAAGGAGVVIPLATLARDDESATSVGESTTSTTEAQTATTVGAGEPAAEVTGFQRVKVASLAELENDVPVTFDYPLEGQPNMLVKLGAPAETGIGPDQDLVAFSTICTHMGCQLEDYIPEHKVLGPCPCHFTTFDLSHDGMVVLGQATQQLPRVLLDVDDEGDVYAVGLLRLVYGYSDSLEGTPVTIEGA